MSRNTMSGILGYTMSLRRNSALGSENLVKMKNTFEAAQKKSVQNLNDRNHVHMLRQRKALMLGAAS